MDAKQAMIMLALTSLAYPVITVEDTYFGFGLDALSNDTNLTVLGLGYNLNQELVLCTNQITWAPNASRDGALIPHAYINLPYRGNSTSVEPILNSLCFHNFTCTLEYLDGDVYRTVSTYNKSVSNLRMDALDPMMTYRASCSVYDIFGYGNTTSARDLAILGEQLKKEDIRIPGNDWTTGLVYAGIWLGALGAIYMTLRIKNKGKAAPPGGAPPQQVAG